MFVQAHVTKSEFFNQLFQRGILEETATVLWSTATKTPGVAEDEGHLVAMDDFRKIIADVDKRYKTAVMKQVESIISQVAYVNLGLCIIAAVVGGLLNNAWTQQAGYCFAMLTVSTTSLVLSGNVNTIFAARPSMAVVVACCFTLLGVSQALLVGPFTAVQILLAGGLLFIR